MGNNFIYKIIGERINKFRKIQKITQEELAKKIGIARTSLVHFENGLQKIQIDKLYLIAKELKQSIYDFLPEDINFSKEIDFISKKRISNDAQEKVKNIINKLEV